MKKLLLLLLILIGASTSVPSLRERVEPRVVPVWDYGLELVEPWVDKALAPFHRWIAMNEARNIAQDLRQREMELRGLPTPRQFPRYLETTMRGRRRGRDPWGVHYYLEYKPDSIFVGSVGPDTERGTADDIRVGIRRR